MFSLLLAILALGLLVIVHEGGHYLMARLSGMRVDVFSIGFGPSLWRFVRGDTTYQIAAVPLGGYVQIAGMNPGEDIDPEDDRAYPNRPAWQRLITIFAGPGINYLFAALVFMGLNFAVGVPVPGKGVIVIQIVSGKPAGPAGVQPGDEILRIDGQPVKSKNDVHTLVQRSQGKPITMELLRDGQPKTLQVKPVQEGGAWFIGLGMGESVERKHEGAWPAIIQGFEAPALLTLNTIDQLYEGIRGKTKLEFGGPVEIVQQMKSRIGMGWVSGLEIVAFISTMLGFFNLLPFPALDGGRLIFLGWEIISRRPVNAKVEQWVHTVGMLILVPLIVFLLGRGVFRLLSPHLH